MVFEHRGLRLGLSVCEDIWQDGPTAAAAAAGAQVLINLNASPFHVGKRVEREALSNVATNVSLTASLQPHQANKWISEAELVKAFRGEAFDAGKPSARNGTEDVSDVVLQRAVDVLKGIRVLMSQR